MVSFSPTGRKRTFIRPSKFVFKYVSLLPMADKTIANKVFIGCPWELKGRYEKIAEKLALKYPLHFFLMDTDKYHHKSLELYKAISDNIESSTNVVCDAYQNNPNVALEYGLAQGMGIEAKLYLYDRKPRISKKEGEKIKILAKINPPIIADLAGHTSSRWKELTRLEELLEEFCKNHDFSIRFENALGKMKKRAKDGRARRPLKRLALKTIHYLDGKSEVKYDILVSHLQSQKFKLKEIKQTLYGLRAGEIISSFSGQYSRVSINKSA